MLNLITSSLICLKLKKKIPKRSKDKGGLWLVIVFFSKLQAIFHKVSYFLRKLLPIYVKACIIMAEVAIRNLFIKRIKIINHILLREVFNRFQCNAQSLRYFNQFLFVINIKVFFFCKSTIKRQ